MNHCPEKLKVQDWLDGELPPHEAARFESHLATCAECEAEAAAYRVVWSELRALPLLDPRPDRKSTRLNSSHIQKSRMPSSA